MQVKTSIAWINDQRGLNGNGEWICQFVIGVVKNILYQNDDAQDMRARFRHGKKGYPTGAKNATIVAVYTVFQVSSWLLPPR
jgi:hypothetical protein